MVAAHQHGADPQPAARVGAALGTQSQSVHGHVRTGQRDPAQLEGKQSADGVDIEVVIELDAEEFTHVLDGKSSRNPLDLVSQVFHRCDLVGVVLVGDLSDDFLQDVLDRHQAGRRTVLIDQ